MPATRTHKPRPATASYEQKQASRRRREAFIEDVDTRRGALTDTINEIAEKHDKDPKVVATQLYAGTTLFKTSRKPSLFNAIEHCKAQEHRLSNEGRDMLPNLAGEVAEMSYHQLSIETKQSYINRLEEHRKETAAARMVSKKDVSKHFGKAMATLRPEMRGLSQRTGCEYLALFVRGNALDSYGGDVLCSPKVTQACLHIFKQTPAEMSLKIEAFCMAGLGAAISASGELDKLNRVESQKAIREKISMGLRDILSMKGVPQNQQPTMKYANYDAFVTKWGIELVGWTEATGVCPIERLNTAPQLRRLLTALNTGTCHWEQLSAEDWAIRKAQYKARVDAGMVRQRAPRRDKGISRKGKLPTSNEIINEESDEESDEENVDPAVMA